MVYFLKAIASFILPPGSFIVILALCAITLRRRQRFISYVVGICTSLLYFLSIPLFSETLIRSLESQYMPPAEVQGDVVIVLGGGATLDTPDVNGQGHLGAHAANRLITGIQLQRILQVPLIVAGGQVYAFSGPEAVIMKRVAAGLGAPAGQVIIESASLNTRQNAENVKRILNEYGFQRPILVTSAFHMPRAIWFFQQQGVAVVPYPADYLVNKAADLSVHKLYPSEGALWGSSLALREHLGFVGAKLLYK